MALLTKRDIFGQICKAEEIERSTAGKSDSRAMGTAHKFNSGGSRMPSLRVVEDRPVIEIPVVAKWDPELTKRVVGILRPLVKRYFRSEVKDLGRVPVGGALLVSNHSGGQTTTDLPTFAVDFYDRFGYDRPLYTLSHDILSIGPTKQLFQRLGFITASRDNAAKALASDAAVMVFPGGDYDATRPTLRQNVIDFNGRTGYVRTAIEAGVPIVPIVSIGGQETQFFLTRGDWLAKRLGLKIMRSELIPIAAGFPFGVTLGGMNLPMPSKIVTQVLPAIDIAKKFGDNPDVAEVDAHVRKVMQKALDRLAKQRRFPVIG
jgi:1-acyl-sn-glycerol-3-phosphate acyltransferase